MLNTDLTTIQRANVVLGVAAVAVSGLLWGGRGMLAAGLGAGLGVANFWAIRRLGARAVVRVAAGQSSGQALILVGALVLKMAVLFGLVWLFVSRAGLPVLPFTIGLSAFVAAVLFGGLFLGAVGSKMPPPTQG